MNELIIILDIIIVVLLLIILWRTWNQNSSLSPEIERLLREQEKLERTIREEMGRNRDEAAAHFRLEREELNRSFSLLRDSQFNHMAEASQLQHQQLESFGKQLAQLAQGNDQRLENMRQTIENRMAALQKDNNYKLEQMRMTVDEKLQSTLEVRLGESFKLVSERLEMVHKGLGEMHALAAGVGDLKKVLANVKTRGTWGEVQLGNILEQVLAAEQFATNVVTKKGSTARVEYAIRLPGQSSDEMIWLPVDAKFPQEDYLRLVEACEDGDAVAAEEAAKQLAVRIKAEAREIAEKYLDPPHTTDFAIMFLPTEGLYAEVSRHPGLTEELQRLYRVSITGPNTMAAFLTSLSMGFRTLAIQKRSSEVWNLLRAVKTEFSKFGQALEKTQKKLQEASNTIEKAANRSRQIEKKLNGIESLPDTEVNEYLDEIQELDERISGVTL
ncbi:MAG: DNA recombination protein RmuC [Syntrophomonadaceae bacterium]|nr:DNA recombination protein RmuC [Syntrophomonadaceae bacterium]